MPLGNHGSGACELQYEQMRALLEVIFFNSRHQLRECFTNLAGF
jgi:hypothetical protein